MIAVSKHARIVIRSSKRKRTLIGPANCIKVNGEVNYGGVAVKQARMLLDVNTKSMSARLTKTKTKVRKRKT